MFYLILTQIIFSLVAAEANLLDDVFRNRLVAEEPVPRSKIAERYGISASDVRNVEDVLLNMARRLTCNDSLKIRSAKSTPRSPYYISQEEIKRVILQGRELSLNEPVGENDSESMQDLMADQTSPDPILENESQEVQEALREIFMNEFEVILREGRFAGNTHPRLRDIFWNRILKDDDNTVSLKQIASRHGVSYQAIDQQEKRLMRELKVRIKKRFEN